MKPIDHRAKTVLELAAEKAGWGQPLPQGFGRGVSLQFVFATYMAQIAEVEVSKDGKVHVHRVICAVDCGIPVNPDTIQAQIQSAIIFGITAALYGEITLKDGRVQRTNFDGYTKCCGSMTRRRSKCTSSKAQSHPAAWARLELRPSSPQSPTLSMLPRASACARCRSMPAC